jgi:predicted nuclease of predicted toxin-antitoxin system
MTVLLDLNLSPLWVPFLASHGVEAIHWATIGDPKAPDSAILELAAAKGYVIFTHDLDFGRLLAFKRSSGPSVIQIRSQDVLPDAVGRIVVSAIRAAERELQLGALVTIDPERHRIRLLPI